MSKQVSMSFEDRMEQYIQMIDYSLWEVIENGNAPPIKKAIEKRFGGNAATKKTQRNLLKQQYENFTASCSEVQREHQAQAQNNKMSPFVSSTSTNSTNGEVNTAHGVTTTSTKATAVNSTTIDNLSDAVIRAFFASQPNSP
ncbi:hypothetical protein Tco_0184753 [Tanacetum coccineum]